MRTRFGGYEFDDETGRLDLDAVWDFLSTEAYWGRWRTRVDVERQIAGAWRVLAAYDADGGLAAFARAISDGVTSAYLGDVFVLPGHRGRGLGIELVRLMVTDGPGAPLRWMLHTGDAHGLYRRFGFAPADPTYLERPRPEPSADPWQDAVEQVWAGAGELDEAAVLDRVRALAAERSGTAAADFELASALDYVGDEAAAEPLYRRAVAGGLDERRAPQAVVQLASTVRNLGRPQDALDLLAAELPPRYRPAQAAFRALALLDRGQDRQAALVALRALAATAPQYGPALTRYLDDLSAGQLDWPGQPSSES